MGKTYVDTVKYIIKARLEASGRVEKPDVVGAIFGQTEGLLGGDLELRELLKTGRIGRIDVKLEHRNGRTFGEINVPSGLSMVETALIAAAIETIDRIGPAEAVIRVEKIEDVRNVKRKRIVERAKELLRKMLEEEIPDSREFIESVIEELRKAEIREYGPERLPAGPDIEEAEEIIVVEGRADVINLLKHGIRNVIALNGARVPKTVVELSKRKKVILFVDGDRGGELIIKNMLENAKVDYIARAPDGKEVEELTQKEILKALRKKTPVEKGEKSKEESLLEEIKGTKKAVLLDEEGNVIKECSVRELVDVLENTENVKSVVMDGVVTQRIVDKARERGVEKIVGVRKGPSLETEGVEVVTA